MAARSTSERHSAGREAYLDKVGRATLPDGTSQTAIMAIHRRSGQHSLDNDLDNAFDFLENYKEETTSGANAAMEKIRSDGVVVGEARKARGSKEQFGDCLLYTSDAADE